MVRVHLFISGLVQGVGFRHFVNRNAEDLGLTGWIKNLPNGGVEAMFESSASSDQEGRKKIEEMVKRCHKGPWMAKVDNVDVTWQEATGEFKTFEVR